MGCNNIKTEILRGLIRILKTRSFKVTLTQLKLERKALDFM